MDILEQIGERLSLYLNKNEIGINELGRRTKTSGAQISNIINGKNYGMAKLLAILEEMPQLNPMWLIQGKGNMDREIAENTLDKNTEMQLQINQAHTRIAFLEMTLNVYKNSFGILKGTNRQLSSIVDFYQNKASEKDKHSG